jgi:hypothetical protein
MSYEPFLIAPYRVGLDTDIEPWLLPEDAFATIRNAHIKHGVVEKRQGYTVFAETAETDANYAISGITQADPGVVTVTSTTSAGTPANITNGTRVQINYVVGMTEVNGQQYLAANVTGTTFELTDLNGNNVDTSAFGAYSSAGYVSVFPANRIMGIGRCYDAQGNRDTIVWDSERSYYYNKTNQSLEPFDLTDIFDSGDEDYVAWANWSSVASSGATPLNRIYFTNGKTVNAGLNGLRFYVCSALPTAPQAASASLFQPTINSSNTIDGAQFVFVLRQRLLLLGTVEGGTSYPQRVRWCKARDPGTPGSFTTQWDDNIPGLGGFVDAPTSEHIVSAQYLQDVIIVWFTNSVWSLRPTADPRLPFRWDKLNSFRGADARMGTIEFDQYVLGVSNRGISITDGNETRRIDDRIEDFVTDKINGDEFGKTYGNRNHQLRRTWILYSGQEDVEGEGEVDAALILDDDSKAWSIYDIDMNVLGHGQTGLDLRLSDFPDTPQSVNPKNLPIYLVDEEYGAGESTIQDYHFEAVDELFLGGDLNGFVYIMDEGLDDNGTPITFDLLTAAWNPYKGQGVECELGYVDFYVDTSPNTKFSVSFIKDNMEAPYKTQGVDCLPDLREIGPIQNVQPKNPSTDGYTIDSFSHGLSTGQTIYMYQIEGPEFLNSQEYVVTVIDENTFDIEQDFSGNGTTITAITQANPAVVTAADHPFADGMEVVISGGDMTEVIGNLYVVANATEDTFELEGIDSTGFTAYTTGGVVFPYYTGGGKITELPFYQGKIWKRVYGGGSGYWHQLEIVQDESNTPFKLYGMMPWFKRTGGRMI